MQRYVRIGDRLIPAEFSGRMKDSDWNDRQSKAITCEMSYEEAITTFVDGMSWSIVEQYDPYIDDEGNTITPDPVEYDNSEFEVLGDITVHKDGTVTVKMGKPTAEELLAVLEEAIK